MAKSNISCNFLFYLIQFFGLLNGVISIFFVGAWKIDILSNDNDFFGLRFDVAILVNSWKCCNIRSTIIESNKKVDNIDCLIIKLAK